VKDVLEFIFLQFEVDHSLGQMITNAVTSAGSSGKAGPCAAKDDSAPSTNEQLNFRSMAGIYWLHVAGVLISACVFIVHKCYYTDRVQRGMSGGIQSVSSSISGWRPPTRTASAAGAGSNGSGSQAQAEEAVAPMPAAQAETTAPTAIPISANSTGEGNPAANTSAARRSPRAWLAPVK
jgi:hypothetical protein